MIAQATMTKKFKRHIATSIALLFCLLVSAQENTWVLHMSTDPAIKAGNTLLWNTHRFPLDNVKKYGKEKSLFVKDITYTSEKGWAIVMNKRYSKQEIVVSDTLPMEAISAHWKAGLKLTTLIYDNNKWIAVLSDDKSIGSQTVLSHSNIQTLLEYKEPKGRKLADICESKGKFYGVYSEMIGAGNQVYTSSKQFPKAWAEQKIKEGYSTTELYYRNETWYVVMTQLPNPNNFQESFYLKKNFTAADYTKANQESKGAISQLAFSFNMRALEEELDNYISMGKSSFRYRKYEDAIEYYNLASAVYPLYDELQFLLLKTKFQLGQYDGVIKQADYILSRLEENNAEAYFYKGAALGYIEMPYEALLALNKAIQNAGSDKELLGKIIFQRAFVYQQLGMLKKGLSDLAYIQKNLSDQDDLVKRANSIKANLEKELAANKEAIVTVYSSLAANEANYNFKTFIAAENLKIANITLTANNKPIAFNFDPSQKPSFGDATVSCNIPLVNGNNNVIVEVRDAANKLIAKKQVDIYYRSKKDQALYHAVLIGVNNYKTFPKLDQPEKDIQVMKRVLSEQYTFANENIYALASPTKSEIFNLLRKIQNRVGPNDNVLVFYAGHGFVDTVGKGQKTATQRGYWIPSNGGTIATKQDWINTLEIADMVNTLKVKNTLVVSDACFSGALLDKKIKFSTAEVVNTNTNCTIDLTKNSTRVLTSGGLTEVDDNSVFIRSFLTILNENKKNCISTREIFLKVYAAAKNKRAVGEPQFGVLNHSTDSGSDFLFIKK